MEEFNYWCICTPNEASLINLFFCKLFDKKYYEELYIENKDAVISLEKNGFNSYYLNFESDPIFYDRNNLLNPIQFCLKLNKLKGYVKKNARK